MLAIFQHAWTYCLNLDWPPTADLVDSPRFSLLPWLGYGMLRVPTRRILVRPTTAPLPRPRTTISREPLVHSNAAERHRFRGPVAAHRSPLGSHRLLPLPDWIAALVAGPSEPFPTSL